MVDEAPYQSTYFLDAYYKSTAVREEDYIPVYDYFFRYDCDCHWIARNYGFENKILRAFLGPFVLGSENMIKWAQRLPFFLLNREKPDVVVDVFIPVENSQKFHYWYVETFNYFPLWIVPYCCGKLYIWMNPDYVNCLESPFFIDFAIYGFRQPDDGRNYYRIIEDKVKELHGFKALITHNYYEQPDFWSIFNRTGYDRIKRRLDPHNVFNDIYTKLHTRR